MEDLLFKYIAEIGVPTSVCFYVLFGVNRTNKDLTDAINKQTAVLNKQTDVLDSMKSFGEKLDRLDSDIRDMQFKLNSAILKSND